MFSSSKQMKAVKIIAILSLLVIFPAISYLYLIRGYNFRLEALNELAPKMEIDIFDHAPLASQESLKQHASIIYNADEANALDLLTPVFEEFSHRSEFQMFGFTIDSTKFLDDYHNDQWKLIYGKYPYEKDLALIDTAAVIRNYYTLDSSSFTSLGQHIPIIIPRKKEQDIVLKREDEK